MSGRLSIIGLSAILALSASATAFAQSDDPDYQRRLDDYRARSQNYQDRSDAYRGRVDDYQARRDAYEQQQGDYQRQRDDYEAARRDYDARYGPGAYDRYQRDHGGPVGPPPPPVNDFAAADACRDRANNRTVAGGLLGALAGAAIGSNVAARNARPEGAVLGAVVGGAVGAGVGRSTATCDNDGYYFRYAETYAYREPSWQRGRSGRYDYAYYRDRNCRLAIAPANWAGRVDDRYVRVCPDGRGRYRITD